MISRLLKKKSYKIICLGLSLLLIIQSGICFAEQPDETELEDMMVSAVVAEEESYNDSVEDGNSTEENYDDSAEAGADVDTAGEIMNTTSARTGGITASDFGLTAKGAILIEASTGTVLYEADADKILSPASITKIMTLILIFDAIASGKISMEDKVVTSAHAKSMGGSQVFLEEGESQTVETLIKCIVIASGNDASVTMAEYIGGTEESFVEMMNERAKGLGMSNTHFVDCCGLTEDASHLTTARDVALMSRELIMKYPKIKEYSTIWMENITHVTNKGSSEFGLANTNKLLKMATNFTTTGLKTGSTSIAKYCVSATAEKDGIELIAVILGAADYKVRFSEAEKLLNYGYSKCQIYKDDDTGRERLPDIKVENGKNDFVKVKYNGDFNYVDINGADLSAVEKRVELCESLKAPVEKGQNAGVLIYELSGKEIGRVDIITEEDVEEAGFKDCIRRIYDVWRL